MSASDFLPPWKMKQTQPIIKLSSPQWSSYTNEYCWEDEELETNKQKLIWIPVLRKHADQLTWKIKNKNNKKGEFTLKYRGEMRKGNLSDLERR